MRSAVLLAALLLCLAGGFAAAKKYKTSGGPVADKLNVHIVTRWLKTVDQYFMGANNSIQHAGVQYILDSVLLALEANPDRKFIYVEQAFYQRWWREADDSTQSRMQQLYASGQLDFVNGGWCMHDEAAAHAVDMIDQTTVGHKYLKEQFGATPSVGWQIDPFGHSATQAALLSAEVGFDSLWFMRLDYQDRGVRLANKNMQFIWRPSASLGPSAQVLTGAFITGYGPPDGFCYDQSCSDPPIQDDTHLYDYNVQDRVDLFVNRSLTDASYSATNNIMFLMGSDFQHENSNDWYKNLDKLIHYVNLDGRVNAFYSTPTMFADALNAANHTWTVKTDDFFPYADWPHAFWTGYFTSRPALKGYVRKGSGFLQASRQLDVFTAQNFSALQHFSEVMGVVQHHDSVSGTAKQHTSYDYAARIATGYSDGMTVSNAAFSSLTQKPGGPSATFTQCENANVSICSPAGSMPFVITVYNPLPRAITETIRIPAPKDVSNIVVQDSNGKFVPYDTINSPVFDQEQGGLPYTLLITVNLPALGFNSYTVAPYFDADDLDGVVARDLESEEAPLKSADPNLTISNNMLSLTFDSTTGLLTSMTNLVSGVTAAVSQQWFWYNSTVCDNNWGYEGQYSQNSGAYIFRPNKTDPYPVATGAVSIAITHNSAVVQEITQSFAPWLNQTVRLYANRPYAEFEWVVGSIPIEDGLGKEVITRFSTNINSGGYVYTDSNGREMQQRLYNYRPTWTLNVTEPVAGNYYPVNAVAFINDTEAQLSVLVDRSQGGASINSGDIELMVHRRLLWDDARGVGEPLNETYGITPYPNPVRIGPGLVIKGFHRVMLDAPANAAKGYRAEMDRIYNPPVIGYAAGASSTFMTTQLFNFSGLMAGADLPINVHILTLQSWAPNTILLRLSHQFGVGEDAQLSQPVSVSLTNLFSTLKLSAVEEVSLTANQPVAQMKANRKRWNTIEADGSVVLGAETKPIIPDPVSLDAPMITLTPLQIRTFLLTVA